MLLGHNTTNTQTRLRGVECVCCFVLCDVYCNTDGHIFTTDAMYRKLPDSFVYFTYTLILLLFFILHPLNLFLIAQNCIHSTATPIHQEPCQLRPTSVCQLPTGHVTRLSKQCFAIFTLPRDSLKLNLFCLFVVLCPRNI